jgi:hypothetical protein
MSHRRFAAVAWSVSVATMCAGAQRRSLPTAPPRRGEDPAAAPLRPLILLLLLLPILRPAETKIRASYLRSDDDERRHSGNRRRPSVGTAGADSRRGRRRRRRSGVGFRLSWSSDPSREQSRSDPGSGSSLSVPSDAAHVSHVRSLLPCHPRCSRRRNDPGGVPHQKEKDSVGRSTGRGATTLLLVAPPTTSSSSSSSSAAAAPCRRRTPPASCVPPPLPG